MQCAVALQGAGAFMYFDKSESKAALKSVQSRQELRKVTHHASKLIRMVMGRKFTEARLIFGLPAVAAVLWLKAANLVTDNLRCRRLAALAARVCQRAL